MSVSYPFYIHNIFIHFPYLKHNIEKNSDQQTVHSFVQLLSLYHDSLLARAISRLPAGIGGGSSIKHHPTAHNRYTRFWTQTSPMYKRIALTLQMIQYTELLCEMVAKRRSERTRWRVVVMLEIIKATCRLLLLRLTNARPLLTSPLPEREIDPAKLEESIQRHQHHHEKSLSMNGHLSAAATAADIDGRGGGTSVVKKPWLEEEEDDQQQQRPSQSPPPTTKPWLMPRTGLTLPSLPSSTSSPENGTAATTTTYLLSHVLKAEDIEPPPALLHKLTSLPSLLGETLYILRPVIYSLALQHYHNNNKSSSSRRTSSSSSKWLPFLLGLSIEYTAYQLAATTNKQQRMTTTATTTTITSPLLQNEEIRKREKALLWWAMRGPVYENITGPYIRKIAGKLKDKPLLGLVGGVLEDYDWLWKEWYFSTATL